jgi:hypothetical protein
LESISDSYWWSEKYLTEKIRQTSCLSILYC